MRELKLYAPGAESEKRVELLIKMTRISSDNIVSAIKDHLTLGWTESQAAFKNKVDIQNLRRALKRVNEIISYHNQLTDLK